MVACWRPGMSEDPKTKMKGSVELDIKGKVAISGEVSGFPAIVNACRSKTGKIDHALADRIANHLRSGKPLNELTPYEQALLIDATGDSVVKAINRAKIVERALAHEPDLAGLLAAPSASDAQETTEEAAEEADERLLFWERFWADAETVSVEYMQEIYARILAGRTRQPKDFSLKTLEVLRYLDSPTAALLKKVGAFAIGKTAGMVPDIFHTVRGYSLKHVRALADSNLLLETTAGFPEGYAYAYQDIYIRAAKTERASLPNVYMLTTAGRELLSLMDLPNSTEHMLWACEALSEHPAIEIAKTRTGPWLHWKEFYKDALAAREAAKQK